MEQQQQQQQQQSPEVSRALFDAVAKKDYRALLEIYGYNARNTVVSFLSMIRYASMNRHGGIGGGSSSSAALLWGGVGRHHHNHHRYGGVAEEKLDEFLQEVSSSGFSSSSFDSSFDMLTAASSSSSLSSASLKSNGGSGADEQCSYYYYLLRELAVLLNDKCLQQDEVEEGNGCVNDGGGSNSKMEHCHQQPLKKKKIEVSAEAERLLRDSAAVLSDTRPPADFVVYQDGTVASSTEGGGSSAQQQQQQQQQRPPIFDGGVANATPPPLGGAAAAAAGGGAGTILHLACALDVPLALAFLLAMGADARATHTAFRRLLIHESACNGSIQCLTLLLELGHRCGDNQYTTSNKNMANNGDSKMPAARSGGATGASPRHVAAAVGGLEFDLPFLPRRMDRAEAIAPLQMYVKQTGLFGRKFMMGINNNNNHSNNSNEVGDNSKSSTNSNGKDFLSMLRLFREYTGKVEKGLISELDAARKILEYATISEPSQKSLARSCGFVPSTSVVPDGGNSNANANANNHNVPRSFLRPHNGGSSDGHGNTPLHWAAFKNEVECVSLLLKYKADPNARAHPSGWTPLHDAAYSNSRETIELLLNAGAQVDARANSGATPLCFAAQEDAAAAAALLLERGADLTTRCAGGPIRDDGSIQPGAGPHSRFSGYTPLHYCAHYNADKAARVLLRHPTAKVAMEIPDLSDRLPIHVAVARGSADVLRELLHAGARMETRSDGGSASAGGASVTGSTRSNSSRSSGGSNRRLRQHAGSAPSTPTRAIEPPHPEQRQPRGVHRTPRSRSNSRGGNSSVGSVTPVSSPLLRSMIPSQPVTSSKPWNCLTQRSIDECRQLISEAEQSWAPDRHSLFTPADRAAVMELLRVGKRLELQGTGIFVDLWPLVLSFCGRGWFEITEEGETDSIMSSEEEEDGISSSDTSVDYLSGFGDVSPNVDPSNNGENHDDSLSLPAF